MFARWGRFVYCFRWATLIASAVLLGLSIAAVLTGANLAGNGGFGANLAAGTAAKLITSEIKAQGSSSGSSFELIYSSPTLTANDPAFQSALENSIASLAFDSRVSSILTPYNVAALQRSAFISRDSHEALVVVELKEGSVKAQAYIDQLAGEVHQGPLAMVVTGQVPINQAFNKTLENDLQQAEYIALPITLVLLVLIFAAFIAALLPLSVGVLAIVGGLGGTLFLAHFTDVSQYAINIVTLIGLGVAIDYSLFIVNRYRDELAAGATREEAIATAISTAGRAITFSGITVAIGLSAMLFFQGTFLASMGAAGAIVVGIAVLYGLTFLPALLSVMGGAVNFRILSWLLGAWGVRPTWWPSHQRQEGGGVWHSMAVWVMRRPVFVLVPALAVLVIAGTPFLQLRLANGDVDQLPPTNLARQGYDTLVKDFPGQDQTSIEAVVYYPDASPLTAAHVGDVYDLSRRFAALPNVLRVDSIVNIDASLSKADYQRLLSGPQASLPVSLQQAVTIGSGSHIVLLNVVTNKQYTSDDARNIVKAVRAEHVPDGQVLATGGTAFDLDIVNFILDKTPIAVGSVILIPVILFSIVFGMSMDYEVLLISRIQEEYRRTGDNQAGVAMGLEKSGRLITGAAAIMVVVFLAFGLASVVIIKAIGIGLAIAIAIDATIVRILIVPSVMRILGRANWWAPRPLTWLHMRLGTGESVPASVPLRS